MTSTEWADRGASTIRSVIPGDGVRFRSGALWPSSRAEAGGEFAKYHSMIPSAGFNYGIELPNDVSQPWYDNRTILEAAKRLENNAKIQDWLANQRLFSPIVQRVLLWTVRPEVAEWRPHFGLSFNSPETVVMR